MNYEGKVAGLLVLAVTVTLGGCSGIHESPDYERHSQSQLSTPMGGGDYLWFDVKLTPEYPDNSEAAEALRMQWLLGWLERRGLCIHGYDILERRAFDFLEHNPARYDLRYKVQCAAVPPAES
ncbi:MAG: hypothetical protein CL799_10860 [Chromatiales bacterium]|jgi:hypothetical protein|nr:hypothetical protein [Chromatiales bacterium]MDP6150031.1 hypothetical protein [Gammaproteobacteria bacterium]MDP7271124.1 hypothetical protein [Gammaproteobacteria bacterium]HJP03988.1 hypothetical protein [Gammaproteobacteria bacterium]